MLEALDAAAALGLVEPVPGSLGEYRFGHVLIRDTLFTGMPIAVRLTGHRVVGEALEQVYRGAIEEHLPEIAHHFLCAAPRGDPAKAVDYAERAAYRALDTLAYEQAVDLFERALAVLERMDADAPRRAGLLLGLGTAQSRAGRPTARATFEAAVAVARSIDADEILARAALGFAPFALTPGYVDEPHVALLGEALEPHRRRRHTRFASGCSARWRWRCTGLTTPRAAPSWQARRWRSRAGWATSPRWRWR